MSKQLYLYIISLVLKYKNEYKTLIYNATYKSYLVQGVLKHLFHNFITAKISPAHNVGINSKKVFEFIAASREILFCDLNQGSERNVKKQKTNKQTHMNSWLQKSCLLWFFLCKTSSSLDLYTKTNHVWSGNRHSEWTIHNWGSLGIKNK